MNAIFITGTDTGVGKTWVTQQLLHQFNHQGYQTFAMKPLASGADYDVQAQQFKK
ncbi:ATP-dependent dethiobiotin synthetase BioD [Rickettsiella massiliensis]|uniref:ATP-dependent dethiobiotin synthetase BioD n=1 Tax=Rickettsiella massiliensis TaxID=676517 RepID=UPI0003016AE2|nr:AAA family ATPase [Rickettsiella massiliensis]